MRRKLWSILLCMSMMLGLLPQVAFAGEHTHCVCGATHKVIGDHTTEKDITWTPIEPKEGETEITSLPNTTGNYYLTADVVLTDSWGAPADTALCLNGHSITSSKNYIISTYAHSDSTPGERNFTLTDCQGTGKITHAQKEDGTPYNGCAIYVNPDSSFTMYGGKISGNTAYGNAAGVQTHSKSIFTMYGGEISDNINTDSYGSGGVHVYSDATFTMYGGKISGNTGYYAGGVSNSGKFIMEGGEISGNTANNSGNSSTPAGGGVRNGGTFRMTGGKISENITKECGAGGVSNSNSFTMEGGEISGNSNTRKSYTNYNFYPCIGGLYTTAASTLTLSGKVIITDNKNNTSETSADSNLYLPQNATITLGTNGLSSNSSIGIGTQTLPSEITSVSLVTTGATADTAACFFSDNKAYSVQVNNGALLLSLLTHSHGVCGEDNCTDHTGLSWTAWSSGARGPSTAGNYYLTEDITITDIWKPADGTVLCLNGHSLALNHSRSDDKTAITIAKNTSFTLTDCRGTGKITHATGKTGIGVSVNTNGRFTMYGGNITGNTIESVNGAGVHNQGSFTMYGGKISGNATGGKGGGVYTEYASASFTMEGGEISDNAAGTEGGGVYLKDGGVSMQGSKISDNTATTDGGGVYIESGSFTMQNSEISGNAAGAEGGGVYLKDGGVSMQGSKISDNTAATEGGGVYIESDTFSMQDSEISDNTAGGEGGGVFVKEYHKLDTPYTEYIPQLQLSGNVDISGNQKNGSPKTANNVYLSDKNASLDETKRNVARTLALSDNLGVNAKIGVTLPDGYENTFISGSGTFLLRNFTSDSAEKTVAADADGKPYLRDVLFVVKQEDTTEIASGDTITTAKPISLKLENPLSKALAMKVVLSDTTHFSLGEIANDTAFTLAAKGAQAFSIVPAADLTTGTYSTTVTLTRTDNGDEIAFTISYVVPESEPEPTPTPTPTPEPEPTPPTPTPEPEPTPTPTPGTNTSSKPHHKKPTAAQKEPENTENPEDSSTIADTKDTTDDTTTRPENATPTFADVKPTAYYYDAVLWAEKRGIISGTAPNQFSPAAPCTRGQALTFLWRMAGAPEPAVAQHFVDVNADAYYQKAIAWAVENGITSGMGNGIFAPNLPCTRAEIITFLYRAAGTPDAAEGLPFTDVPMDAYYQKAAAWAAENGVADGLGDGSFAPLETCTRGEIVAFLFRS